MAGLWAMCATAALILAGCGGQPPAAQPAANAQPAQAQNASAGNVDNPVERGKYLVTILGCNDCHTPKKNGPNGPEPDTAKLLSGHPEDMKMPAPPKLAADSPWAVVASPMLTAWSGPWGVSFAANLTPDQNTGLGTWTEDMFIKAMRTGRHMGVSRPILPPMPWQDFSQMTDADLKAVFAYLRTVPAVVNHVPDPIPPAGAAQ